MKKKKILITIILMFLVTPISKTSAMMKDKSISSSKNQGQEPNQKIFGEIKSKIKQLYNKYRDNLNGYAYDVINIVNGTLNKTDIEQKDYDEAIKEIEKIQKEIEKTRTEIKKAMEEIAEEIENQIKYKEDKTELEKYLEELYDSLKEYKFYTSSGEKVTIFELCEIEINKIDINWKIVKFYNNYRDKFANYYKEVRDIVNGILNKTDIEQKNVKEAIQKIKKIQEKIEKTRTEINNNAQKEKATIEKEIEDKIKFEEDKTGLKKYLEELYNDLKEYTVYTSSGDEVSILELCGIEIKKIDIKWKIVKFYNEYRDKLNGYGIEVNKIARGILNKTDIEQKDYDKAIKEIEKIQEKIDKTSEEIKKAMEEIEEEINKIENEEEKTDLKEDLEEMYKDLKEYTVYTSSGDEVSILELCGIEIKKIDIKWKIVKFYNKYRDKLNDYVEKVTDIVNGILNKTDIKQEDYDKAKKEIEKIQKEINNNAQKEKATIEKEINEKIKNKKDKTELENCLKKMYNSLEKYKVQTSSDEEVSIFEFCEIAKEIINIYCEIINLYDEYSDKLYGYGEKVTDIVNGILNKIDVEQKDYDEAKQKIEKIQEKINETLREKEEEKTMIEKEIEDKIKFEEDKTELKKYLEELYNDLKEYTVYTSSGDEVSILELCGIEINSIDINWKIVKLYNEYFDIFCDYGEEVKDIVNGILNKTDIEQKDYDEAKKKSKKYKKKLIKHE